MDRKYLIIAALGSIIFLSLVAIGLFLGISFLKRPATIIPPAPITTPPVVSTPSAIPVSKYASDPVLLQIRSDTQKLGSDIDSVDLIEPKISPPSLDLNINIKSGP